jgi:hypothetical protein
MVDVLMPYAEQPPGATSLAAARLSTVNGRTVGIVNNSWRCMNVIADELSALLTTEHGVARIVERRISAAQTLPDDMLAELAADCDAVVVGIGN